MFSLSLKYRNKEEKKNKKHTHIQTESKNKQAKKEKVKKCSNKAKWDKKKYKNIIEFALCWPITSGDRSYAEV